MQASSTADAHPLFGAQAPEPRLRLTTVLKYAVLVLALVIVIFPLYWLAITGFKFHKEIFSTSPTIFPSEPTLDICRKLFAKRNVGQFVVNSTIVVTFSVA